MSNFTANEYRRFAGLFVVPSGLITVWRKHEAESSKPNEITFNRKNPALVIYNQLSHNVEIVSNEETPLELRSH